MSVAILVPVLNRPQRVVPLLQSIAAATPQPHRTLFICDHDDQLEHDAVRAAAADMLLCDGNYAVKIAAGVDVTDEPLVFLGADDLDFHPGWLPAAAAHVRDGVQVVGVNDLIPRRLDRHRHATHFLMTRAYALQPTIDGRPGPLYQGYTHNFVDDELIATATHRNAYTYADDAHVRHEHPMAGTAPDDDTYRKGRAHFRRDRIRYARRSPLWT